jgi:hypothetical protein
VYNDWVQWRNQDIIQQIVRNFNSSEADHVVQKKKDVISNRPEAYIIYVISDKARLMSDARLFLPQKAERAVYR